MILDQNTASEIVRNVLGAANQKAQVLIEADLHAVSVKEVKGLLKDAGIDLRSLKGERKHAARHGVEVKSGRRRKPYKKPEILPEPPTEEQAAKVYEEFGVPGFIKPNLTESEQKAIDDLKEARTISSTIEETAAEKQQEPLPESKSLGQPCEPGAFLMYGKPPMKIAELEEVFDGLRNKAEKLREQRRELAEQLRKTDDLLAYISMRCGIIAETTGESEKEEPVDCITTGYET